jgi:hypothetical protein
VTGGENGGLGGGGAGCTVEGSACIWGGWGGGGAGSGNVSLTGSGGGGGNGGSVTRFNTSLPQMVHIAGEIEYTSASRPLILT